MNRYITTTLPYVNDDPHLGHALEFVQADFLARTLRYQGKEVFLNVGTDEHGVKIANRAKESGQTPQAFVDDYAGRFKVFTDTLGISYDAFTRTTSDSHVSAAQEFWKRCDSAGDIYKAQYEVKYCVGCELEKTDSELVDGQCPLHANKDIEIRTEENYYFRFSKYQDKLLAHYSANSDFVTPSTRLKEIVSFVESGLKDFSISRPVEKMSWGIPVPDDDTHTMYVWFDALVNYISAIGWPENTETFEKWWPVTQLAGKDNLRQQSAMWQAMLLSAGIPLSNQIFIHGFITSDGQKMSKSIGNVINPKEITDHYGAEALRYILLRHMSPFEDSDLTKESIHEYYTANLVNGLGNLVARIMKLAEEHLSTPAILNTANEPLDASFYEKVETFRFNEAIEIIFAWIAECDTYMAERAPYKGIKSKDESVRSVAQKDILYLVTRLAMISQHLNGVMPKTSAVITEAIRTNTRPENLFPRI